MHMIVFTYLCYQEVGWVAFVVLFFFILQIPTQLALAKIFTKFRLDQVIIEPCIIIHIRTCTHTHTHTYTHTISLCKCT